MSTFSISFDLATNCPTLGMGFEFWIDDEVWVDRPAIEQAETIRVDNISDSADTVTKTMNFVFKNKELWHTIVDTNGNFIQDPVITINNFRIDDIDCDNILHQFGEYYHDYNGTKELTIEKFYGTMGCRGRVILEFRTPIFVWLLEHM